MKNWTSHPAEFQIVHAGLQVVSRIFAIKKKKKRNMLNFTLQ